MSLEAMGERFASMLDVTIAYAGGSPTFRQSLCGEVPDVAVQVRQIAIPPDLLGGDYAGDNAYRRRLHGWLEDICIEKDDQLERLLTSSGPRPPLASTPA